MEAGSQIIQVIKVHEMDVIEIGAWENHCGTFSFGLWQFFTIVNQLLVLFTEIKNG